MRVEELRIGNLVKGIGHDLTWKVEGVDKDFIFSNRHWRIITSFEPIRISDYYDFNYDFLEINYNNKIRLQIYKSSNVIVFTANDIFSFEDYKVHQLQNLYFALTGEELELK